MATDYARLFKEHFPGPIAQDADGRPSTDGTLTAEDDETWLRRIIEEDGISVLDFKIPPDLGPLCFRSEDVLGPAPTGNGKSPRIQ